MYDNCHAHTAVEWVAVCAGRQWPASMHLTATATNRLIIAYLFARWQQLYGTDYRRFRWSTPIRLQGLTTIVGSGVMRYCTGIRKGSVPAVNGLTSAVF